MALFTKAAFPVRQGDAITFFLPPQRRYGHG